MLVNHTLTASALCPVNGARDVYEVTLQLTGLVHVETIIAKIADFAPLRMYQEDLTQALADAFNCTVESVGFHSGVKTRCICHALSGQRIDQNRAKTGRKRATKSRRAADAGKRQRGS